MTPIEPTTMVGSCEQVAPMTFERSRPNSFVHCSLEVIGALLLWASGLGLAWSGELGKLLTTPEERALIAANRTGGKAGAGEGEGEGEGEGVAAPLLKFDGVARAEDGELDIWINGKNYGDRSAIRGMGMTLAVRPGNRVLLALLDERQKVIYLRPGQAYDRVTGRVLESWEWISRAAVRSDVVQEDSDVSEADLSNAANQTQEVQDTLPGQ